MTIIISTEGVRISENAYNRAPRGGQQNSGASLPQPDTHAAQAPPCVPTMHAVATNHLHIMETFIFVLSKMFHLVYS